MKKITFLSVLFLALLTSCQKEEKCDGAKVTVSNFGETQLTVYSPEGNIGILPGKSATYTVPSEMYQLTTSYSWGGDQKWYNFTTIGTPCDEIEITLP